jgi:DNA mismatch repair ATPase MutS
METVEENNKLYYKYILQEGISEVKGGFKVLSDMNYPSEIIEKTNKYNSFP